MGTESGHPRAEAGSSIERWQRISRIVDVVLEMDPANRPACLDAQCGGDAELRAEVEKFLAACELVERSSDFLKEPAHRHALPLVDAVEGQIANTRAGLPAMVAAALAGRYEIRSELGTGGNATVFRATDLATGNIVAIKVFHAGLSQTIGSERFLREVRITSSLQHRSILPVLDAGVAGDLLYYVMPYVSGHTLRERMRREQQMDVEAVLCIARNVAAALDEAHAHGFVHRDVKPQNILLDGEEAFVADFGIARAIETGGDSLTESGALLGTPTYMSPEQASGETTIDRRSDVYSLACVLYEMLVGEPPFSGATTKAILAKQILAPVPDMRVVRPSLPPAVNDVMSHALAKRREDRYESASTFVAALAHALVGPSQERHRRRQVVVGATFVLVIAIAASAIRGGGVGASAAAALDTTLVALLPLEHDDSSTRASADDDLLHESFSRWTGLTVVDPFLVADAVRQRGAVRSAGDATDIARGLGAGHFVRGRVTTRAGESRLFLAMYDTRDGRTLYHVTGIVPTEPASARAAYAQLSDSLLLRGATGRAASIGQSRSRSLPAMQAITRARVALDDWELSAADSALQVALSFDVRDPWMNLWAAQVRAWQGMPKTSWSTAATRAAADPGSLSTREQALARALALLAAGDYAGACRTYDELRRDNERDFAAWYGLGQCRRMDRLVVPDPTSPSKWRFRSNYDSALTAFTTAFELLPSALHAYEPGSFGRLRNLLLLSTTLVHGMSADSVSFYARPGYIDNKVVLVPYPWKRVSAGDPTAIPPGFSRAIAVQLERFSRIAGMWSATFPRSAAAKSAVALALELLQDPAAIDTLREARRIATDSTQKNELAANEAILLVKFGAGDRPAFLREASRLADAVLRALHTGSGVVPVHAATVAALRGRCAEAQSLSERAPSSPEFHEALQRASALSDGLAIRAGLGCSIGRGELAALSTAIEAALRTFPPLERPRYEEMLLFRPALLASTLDSAVVDRLGRNTTKGLLGAARAYVRHDIAGARQALAASIAERRVSSAPITPDMTLATAQLQLAAADTANAIVLMDRALNHVGAYNPEVIRDPIALASLIRLMILRTQVAQHRGDEVTARRWAVSVFAVWSAADPELQRDIEPFRHLTRGP